MARNGLLTEQEWSEPTATFRGYSYHPSAAPALVPPDSTVGLCSCELPSKVKSIRTLSQHRISCGRPWSTVESLGLTGEAARLPGQPPQCQSQATP